MVISDMSLARQRVGLDEVVVDAEEALDAVEGADLLDLRVGLASRSSFRGPNGLEIDKETTRDRLSRRRFMKMA